MFLIYSTSAGIILGEEDLLAFPAACGTNPTPTAFFWPSYDQYIPIFPVGWKGMKSRGRQPFFMFLYDSTTIYNPYIPSAGASYQAISAGNFAVSLNGLLLGFPCDFTLPTRSCWFMPNGLHIDKSSYPVSWRQWFSFMMTIMEVLFCTSSLLPGTPRTSRIPACRGCGSTLSSPNQMPGSIPQSSGHGDAGAFQPTSTCAAVPGN